MALEACGPHWPTISGYAPAKWHAISVIPSFASNGRIDIAGKACAVLNSHIGVDFSVRQGRAENRSQESGQVRAGLFRAKVFSRRLFREGGAVAGFTIVRPGDAQGKKKLATGEKGKRKKKKEWSL